MCITFKFELGNLLTIVRTSALAFAVGYATVSSLPTSAYAQTAEATADGGGSGEATGSESSSADFGGHGSVDTGSGGNPSATGEASTSASAESNGSNSAETQTDTTANAQGTGGIYSANAEANSTTGVNTIETSLTAIAEAVAGVAPEAAASTIEDGVQTTSAQALHGQLAKTACAGACMQSYEKVGKKKTVAFAVLNNAFSLAMTSKKSAYAKSGIYSDLSIKEQRQYGKIFGNAFAAAEAFANQKGAHANAEAAASAFNYGGTKDVQLSQRGGQSGFARANSFARATACVGDCKRGGAARVAAPPAFNVIRDCDLVQGKYGQGHFRRCEYRIVIR